MSEKSSDSSESELSACSSNFNPIKALYSKKTPVPVETAPIYDNISSFLSSQKGITTSVPVGRHDLIAKQNLEKAKKKEEEEQKLQEIQSQRFKDVQVYTSVPRKPWKQNKNLLKRMDNMSGPLAALRECVMRRFRVKVITRNESGVRGHLIGSVEAFDKQWNLAMTDVLEVWYRKVKTKRKVPACMGTPCPPGSAAAMVKLPSVSETRIKKGLVECSRYMPQLLMRGEHVVLVSILEGL